MTSPVSSYTFHEPILHHYYLQNYLDLHHDYLHNCQFYIFTSSSLFCFPNQTFNSTGFYHGYMQFKIFNKSSCKLVNLQSLFLSFCLDQPFIYGKHMQLICQASMMGLFCKNGKWISAFNYFCKTFLF